VADSTRAARPKDRSAKPSFNGSNPLRASIPDTGLGQLLKDFGPFSDFTEVHSRNIARLGNRTRSTLGQGLGRGWEALPFAPWQSTLLSRLRDCGDHIGAIDGAELVGLRGVGVLDDRSKIVVSQDAGERGEESPSLGSSGGKGAVVGAHPLRAGGGLRPSAVYRSDEQR
jgi:hypothetical protein